MAIIDILESKRHKELLQAFDKIVPVDKSPETVKAIGELGNQLSKKLESFVAVINTLPAPNVTVPAKVNFNTDKINQLARDILDSLNDILASVNEIKNKPVANEWVHKVTARDKDGLISKITSKAIFEK